MENRKIQKVGHSTLTVSLPSRWVNEVGLKQGDTIFFSTEKDNSLKIMPTGSTNPKKDTSKCTINSDLCDDGGMLERVIVGCYIVGRDAITIASSKKITTGHIAETRVAVQKLMGLDIVEETSNKIVLQCFIDPTKFPLPTLLKRLFVIVSTMQTEAMEAFVKFDIEIAEEVIKREDEADRMYWLIVRLLHLVQEDASILDELGLDEPTLVLGYRIIAKYFETIADCSRNMARNVIEIDKCKDKIKKPVIKIISEMGDLSLNMCQKSMECFFSGDIRCVNRVIQARADVDVKESKLMEIIELGNFDVFLATHLRCFSWNLRRIAEHGASIAHIVINRSLKKSSKICKVD